MKPLVQLVVLGAGMIGKTIAFWAKRQDWDVIVVDPGLTSDQFHYDDIFHRCVNGWMEKIMKVDFVQNDGIDYVTNNSFAPGTYFMNTMPIYKSATVVDLIKTINKHGGHYLDLSEDLGCSLAIRAEFEKHVGTLISPHCGLAPGMSTIQCANMMTQFDEIVSATINVGALPKNVGNKYAYYPTWSPEGLVNEYVNSNRCIQDGFLTERRPNFRDIQHVYLEGIHYESCPTSGGLGTMAMNPPHPIYNLEYRTLRYPGHWKIVGDLLMANDNGVLTYMGPKTLLSDMRGLRQQGMDQDQVLIHIEVEGIKNLRKSVARYTQRIMGTTPHLAIQTTTAFGPLMIIDSHAKKLLPSRYLPQEEIRLTPGIDKSPFNYLNRQPSALHGIGLSM